MLSYTCRMYNEAYQRYHRGKISYDDFEFDVTRPKTCYKREFAITGKAKRPQLVLIARPVKEQEWEMIVHRGSTFVLEVMERFVRPEAKISKTGFFTIKTMSMSTKDYIGASTPNGCQVTAVSGGGGFGHYSKETWSRPTEGAGIGVGFTLRDIRDIVTGRYEGNPSADYEGHRRRVRICVLAFDGGDPFNLLDAAVDCDNDEQVSSLWLRGTLSDCYCSAQS